VNINGRHWWLWRAVDQHGTVLDVLVQSRRNREAAERLMRKLIRRHGLPRVMITDKLKSYATAKADLGLKLEHPTLICQSMNVLVHRCKIRR
jgi:putative transposase